MLFRYILNYLDIYHIYLYITIKCCYFSLTLVSFFMFFNELINKMYKIIWFILNDSSNIYILIGCELVAR